MSQKVKTDTLNTALPVDYVDRLEADIQSTYKVTVVQAEDVPRALQDTDPNRPVAIICTLEAWSSMFTWFDQSFSGRLDLTAFFKERGIPVFIADKDHNLMKCISDIIGMHANAQIIRVV